MIGQTISHYKILEKLGEGGMGVIYKAEDIKLHRPVALKVLPRQALITEEDKTRFAREAQAAASLSHPNVAMIHEFDEVDDPVTGGKLAFIAMEYVDGETVKQKIKDRPLPIDEAIKIGIATAEGLSEAHGKGIIHRDIKSDNVMLTRSGVVKIMDFGLAEVTGRTRVTKEGMTVGTVAYMSPEQALGEKLDQRTDIWSLGVVLYEVITGRLPFAGDYEQAIVYRILNEEPEPITSLRSNVPMELERIVKKAMQKSVVDRYQHVDEMLTDLRSLKKKLESGVAKEPPGEARPRRKRAALYGGVAALGLVLVVGGLLLFRGGERGAPGAKKMLVVLPFENLGLPGDEYFAAGMTEEITSRLAAVSGLGVISRTSAVHYAGTDKPIKQIAKELGVEYVLEGTVRWAREPAGAHRVRITPQLIRVSDDTHLWAESYERVISDIFAIQSEIAQAVSEKLGVTLLEKERKAVGVQRTKNLEAYQAYLRGRHYEGRPHFSVDDWKQVVQSYQQAVDLDPEFALAFAELSKAHSRFYYLRYDLSEERQFLAKRAIDRAVALAPDAPETHLALGYYYFWALREPDRALKEIATAAEGLPENAEILEAKAELLRMQGRMEEAARDYKEAFKLSPRSASAILELGITYWWSRKYPEALEACNQAIALAPDAAWPYLTKAFNYWSWRGATKEARAALEGVPMEHEWAPWAWYWQEIFEGRYKEALEHLSSSSDEWIRLKMWAIPKSLLSAYAYDFLNEPQRARAAYESAKSLLETEVNAHPEDARYRSSMGIAYAALGRKEEAIREGKRAIELFPLSKDAVYALGHVQDLAHIYTIVGEYDLAIDELEQLLSNPGYISVSWLKIDPRWNRLRNNRRFQKLLEKYPGND